MEDPAATATDFSHIGLSFTDGVSFGKGSVRNIASSPGGGAMTAAGGSLITAAVGAAAAATAPVWLLYAGAMVSQLPTEGLIAHGTACTRHRSISLRNFETRGEGWGFGALAGVGAATWHPAAAASLSSTLVTSLIAFSSLTNGARPIVIARRIRVGRALPNNAYHSTGYKTSN